MTRQAIDQQPGALPDIRTDDSNVTFTMMPSGTHRHEQLVLRCDAEGEIWVSLARTSHDEQGAPRRNPFDLGRA